MLDELQEIKSNQKRMLMTMKRLEEANEKSFLVSNTEYVVTQ